MSALVVSLTVTANSDKISGRLKMSYTKFGCVLNQNQLSTGKQYLGYTEFPSTGFHMWEHKWDYHVFENVRNMTVKVSNASIL